MSLDLLPKDLLIEIAILLSPRALYYWLQCDKKLMEIVQNNHFWRRKFIREYGNINYDGNWSTLYQNYTDVWSCGSDGCGQLGLGEKKETSKLDNVENFRAKKIAAGDSQSTFLDLNDNIFVCGAVQGEKQTIPKIIPNIKAKHITSCYCSSIIVDDNNVYKTSDDDDLLIEVFNSPVKKVSAGINHILAMDTNNYIWIAGRPGELGPTKLMESKAKYMSAGANGSLLIDMNNDIWVFGDNVWLTWFSDSTYKKIPNLKAKKVACGLFHALVLDLENNVWAFGRNFHGELGLGHNKKVNVPTCIPNLKAKKIAVGTCHSIVLDLNNNVQVFGDNSLGQLGLGDYRDRYIPTRIPGLKAKTISAGTYHTVIIGAVL